MSGEAQEGPRQENKKSSRLHGPWSSVPFHPICAAAFPILALYARNFDQLSARQIARPLGLGLFSAILVWLLAALATRNVRKGALAASAAVLALFSYSHVANLLPASLRVLAGPGCAAATGAVFISLLRVRRPLWAATRAVNLASLVLIGPSCLAIVVGTATYRVQRVDGLKRYEHKKPVEPPASADLPDIYYIIPDAYIRSDRMRDLYGYDNSSFIEALRARGFYVASHSLSNYGETPLSLASSLNMTYLDGLARRVGPATTDIDFARVMLDDNLVANELRTLGYHYLYLGCASPLVRVTTADLKLQARLGVPDNEALGSTPLGQLTALDRQACNEQRTLIKEVFKNLAGVSALPYPKFVLAHIAAPHPPFVFNADGSPRDPGGPATTEDGSWLLRKMSPEAYRAGYIAQARYVTSRLIETVDAIVRGSKRTPIIIIQGDHGSRLHMDWDDLDKTDLREPFSILNAYLVPPKLKAQLYDRISPVNTFRLLLTQRFGFRYPPLPDRCYYSTIRRPYDFIDVTGRVPNS